MTNRLQDRRTVVQMLVASITGAALPAIPSCSRAQRPSRPQAGPITEFALPNPDSAPDDIVVGPDGNLWFTELKGNRTGPITPEGQITENQRPNPKPGPPGPRSGPH